MSGLDVMAAGSKLNQVKVIGVREGSPADLAGIQVDDIITSINGLNTEDVSFAVITTSLRQKPGKKVNIKIRRKGEIIKTSFKLERMI
jgi:C-terminal processing protease CtpA/Prc